MIPYKSYPFKVCAEFSGDNFLFSGDFPFIFCECIEFG